MPKVWDDLLEEYERQGKIIRIEIEGDHNVGAYGEYAFTTQSARDWAASNCDYNDRLRPWAGINDVIYFTFKDEPVHFIDEERPEAPCGFHANNYSADEGFRLFFILEAKLYFARKLRNLKENSPGQHRYIGWETIMDREAAKKILDLIIRFTHNVLPDKHYR